MPNNQLNLYTFELSGHCHRVELFLSLLGIPHTKTNVDLRAGEQKNASFIAINSFGQVPVLQDGTNIICDSNAILVYLALKYDPQRKWYPSDLVTIANIQRWLSAAAGLLAFGPANMRAAKIFGREVDKRAPDITSKLLDVVNAELKTKQFICTNFSPTIADIALYTYIAHSPEGGINLEDFSYIALWLKRIESLNGYVSMKKNST